MCVWLGEGDDEGRSAEAMDFIPHVVDMATLETAVDDKSKAAQWKALTELMRDPWFSRRWVVQEILLARRATLHCGDRIAHWTDFADAISLCVTNRERLRSLFDFAQWRYGPKTLGEIQASSASVLLRTTNSLFQRAEDGSLDRPTKSLEYLVTSLTTFDTSNPRDIIYSLVHIASDTSTSFTGSSRGRKDIKGLDINYDKPIINVYSDFTRFCIESSLSLDIICRPWAVADTDGSSTTASDSDTDDSGSNGGVESDNSHGNDDDNDDDVHEHEDGHEHSDDKDDDDNDNEVHEHEDDREHGDDKDDENEHDVEEDDGETAAFKQRERKKERQKKKLPSWIPMLEDSEFGKPGEEYWGRKNGECFVGRAGQRRYQASGNTKPDFKFLAFPFPGPSDGTANDSDSGSARDMNMLRVRGFELAVIRKISPVSRGGLILRESLRMAGWPGRTYDDDKDYSSTRSRGDKGDDEKAMMRDQVWRTLIADRDADGEVPPTWYQRVCMRCLDMADMFYNGDLNIGQLLHQDSEMLRIYLTRVRNTTWNRRFFRASMKRKSSGKDEGADSAQGTKTVVGLCPRGTEIGDVVCILYGCSVPVVLRCREKGKKTEKSAHGKDNPLPYELIGECYVHGKMDEQAMKDLARKETKSEEMWFGLI